MGVSKTKATILVSCSVYSWTVAIASSSQVVCLLRGIFVAERVYPSFIYFNEDVPKELLTKQNIILLHFFWLSSIEEKKRTRKKKKKHIEIIIWSQLLLHDCSRSHISWLLKLCFLFVCWNLMERFMFILISFITQLLKVVTQAHQYRVLLAQHRQMFPCSKWK